MPVLPSAVDHQASRSLWGPVTVRVAWELVLAGIEVRPTVLAEAREHALRCLPYGVGPVEAEELASHAVVEWLERGRHRRYRRAAADADLGLPLTPAWRSRLRAALDPLSDTVLRMHYGDGFALDAVARSAAVPLDALEVARGGIREAVRTIAMEEGLPVRSWPVARLDALIGRIARIAEPGCPGPGGLLTDAGRTHADRCPRCSRAVRLVRSGVLSPGDLFPPPGDDPRPKDRIGLLALMLHPDGRRHRARLEQALAGLSVPIGSNTWLVADVDLPELAPRLHDLALAGTPARHHLRGALVHASGRWIAHRVIGPAPHDAVDAARACTWGELDGMDPLPAPLPPPPKATRWWIAAGLLVALAAAVGAHLAQADPVPPTWPVHARFEPGPGGGFACFDVDELAVVDVLTVRDGSLAPVARSVRADKGRWATGDGSYRLPVDGDRAVVIASPTGLPDLDDAISRSNEAADPVAELQTLVALQDPRADLAVTPPPPATGALP